MNMILIGAQGSGKGTQAQLLADALHLQPTSSGDLLRTAIASETSLGRTAKPYVERGDLVPDTLVVEMILDSIRSLDGAQGIILDGFPRNIAQAEALDARLLALGQSIDAVVYLEVPREQLLDRLSGRYVCRAHGHVWNMKTHPPRVAGICDYDGSDLTQRADDQPDKIARRLDIFFTETIRLIDYYGPQGKLVRVDGTGAIEDVNHSILAGMERLPSLKGGALAPVLPQTVSLQEIAG
ncbi:MAG: adenylate kinase [Ktedonobacterales bacterium]